MKDLIIDLVSSPTPLATVAEQKNLSLRSAVYMQVAHYLRRSRKVLTSPTQYKLLKGQKEFGYATVGLNLAPATEAYFLTRVNMCPSASKGCLATCLRHSGQNIFTQGKIARIARTVLWLEFRPEFLAIVGAEVRRWRRWSKARGLQLAFRANLLSDSAELAQSVQDEVYNDDTFAGDEALPFYDYTANEVDMYLEDGITRVFSRKEDNEDAVMRVLGHGLPVSVVFGSNDLPSQWRGYDVIDGDEHDLRFIDANGPVVIGLRVKGARSETKQRAIASGFAVAA